MDRDTLRALQMPLKEKYQTEPETAVATLHALGHVDFNATGCRVALPCNNGQEITAGLHPMAGGDGTQACSGDMLLQALVTCAGTTLAAVSISMNLSISRAEIEALGTMDFRGTLGVDKGTAVGFTSIELVFRLETTADADQIRKLLQLTERYCVVYQTLAKGVALASRLA